MPGVSQIGVAVNRDRGDRTAVFRMEVPDVNAGQFAGLTAYYSRFNFHYLAVTADSASVGFGASSRPLAYAAATAQSSCDCWKVTVSGMGFSVMMK